MMGLLEDIGNNIKFVAIKGIEHNIDGREIGIKLEKALDGQLGEKISEKTQRQPVTNFLFEVVEGLWEDGLEDLIKRLEEWIASLKKKI